MGQFIDYIASVFNLNNNRNNQHEIDDNHHHESSFTKAFTRGDPDKANKLASLSSSNRKTIHIYQALGAVAFIAHLSLVTLPKVQLETFDLLEPAGWQLLTLTVLPLVVYFASIGAMIEVNRPLAEGAKLSAKNSGLDLNNNDFVHSLKIVMILMAVGQLSSIFSDQLIWSVVLIVPLWCYQLTSKLAHNEYQRYAPSPKKQWVKLAMGGGSPKPPKSPAKPASPVKQAPVTRARSDNNQVPATPRTRIRRAVRSTMTNMSEKYHAFEQTLAHQVSQKIVAPLSPKMKSIEQS